MSNELVMTKDWSGFLIRPVFQKLAGQKPSPSENYRLTAWTLTSKCNTKIIIITFFLHLSRDIMMLFTYGSPVILYSHNTIIL